RPPTATPPIPQQAARSPPATPSRSHIRACRPSTGAATNGGCTPGPGGGGGGGGVPGGGGGVPGGGGGTPGGPHPPGGPAEAVGGTAGSGAVMTGSPRPPRRCDG